jgi:hypothetical protein
MSASYPTSVKVWSPQDAGFNYPEDLKEIVYARHVTSLYDEVTAIQQELGAGSLKTSVVDNATAFDALTSNKAWASFRLRLNNLEQGVLDGVNRRVKTTGSSSIVSSGSTVGLIIRTSGTGNLLEIRNTADALVNRFDKDGVFQGVIDGGTA